MGGLSDTQQGKTITGLHEKRNFMTQNYRTSGKMRILSVIAVATVSVTVLAACGNSTGSTSNGTSRPKLALIEVGPDAFSSAQTQAFVNEAKRQGIDYRTFNAQGSPTRMVSQIDQAVSQKMDGIILQAADSLSATVPIDQANKAGVCTVAVTVPVGKSDSKVYPGMKAYVGWNALQGGRYEGMGLAKLMGGAGGVVIIQGSLSNGSASLRQKGAEQVWKEKYPGIKVLDMVQTNFDNTVVQKDMRNLITKYGSQMKGVLSITDPMAAAAVQVINQSKLKGNVAVMGFAGQKDFVQQFTTSDIKAGTIPEAPASEVKEAISQALACIKGDKKPVYVDQTSLPSIAKLKGSNYLLDKSNASLFTPQW